MQICWRSDCIHCLGVAVNPLATGTPSGAVTSVCSLRCCFDSPIDGANRDSLVQGLRTHGHRNVVPLDGPERLSLLVAGMAQSGDYVVCLGAGSITQWAYALPGELAAAS